MIETNDERQWIMLEHRFEILGKEVCFEGFLRLERFRLRHTLFNGGWSAPLVRERLERGHAAAVLPYDPRRDEVVLIKQFRIGALEASGGPWLTEIVAGMLGPRERPEEVVRREALEEAGCRLGRLIPICDYLVSPGGTSERIALYCGEADAAFAGGIHGLAEEDEDPCAGRDAGRGACHGGARPDQFRQSRHRVAVAGAQPRACAPVVDRPGDGLRSG